jgi:hypothetical protein
LAPSASKTPHDWFVPLAEPVQVQPAALLRSGQLQANADQIEARGTSAGGAFGTWDNPKPISIVPTSYPQEPSGPITVQNHITINGADFHEFEAKMNEVLAELRKSNEIAGEVRDKVVAEMNAGMTILKSPKPDPRVIDLLLIRPLKYLGDKGGGAAIGALATMALAVLLRMMGIG